MHFTLQSQLVHISCIWGFHSIRKPRSPQGYLRDFLQIHSHVLLLLSKTLQCGWQPHNKWHILEMIGSCEHCRHQKGLSDMISYTWNNMKPFQDINCGPHEIKITHIYYMSIICYIYFSNFLSFLFPKNCGSVYTTITTIGICLNYWWLSNFFAINHTCFFVCCFCECKIPNWPVLSLCVDGQEASKWRWDGDEVHHLHFLLCITAQQSQNSLRFDQKNLPEAQT